MKHTMIPCPTEQAQVIDAPICRTLRNNLVSPDAAQPGDLVAIERVLTSSPP